MINTQLNIKRKWERKLRFNISESDWDNTIHGHEANYPEKIQQTLKYEIPEMSCMLIYRCNLSKKWI